MDSDSFTEFFLKHKCKEIELKEDDLQESDIDQFSDDSFELGTHKTSIPSFRPLDQTDKAIDGSVSSDNEDEDEIEASSLRRKVDGQNAPATFTSLGNNNEDCVSCSEISASNFIHLTAEKMKELTHRFKMEGGQNDFDIYMKDVKEMEENKSVGRLEVENSDSVSPKNHSVMIVGGIQVECDESAGIVNPADVPVSELMNAAKHLDVRTVPLSGIKSEDVKKDLRAGFLSFLQKYNDIGTNEIT